MFCGDPFARMSFGEITPSQPELVTIDDQLEDVSPVEAASGRASTSSKATAEFAPKFEDATKLQFQLAAITEEKNALSAKLATILQREIDNSLSSLDPTTTPGHEEEKTILAQLQEALNHAKLLYEENVTLKGQLATAQMQTVEKKRLEAELQRIKEHWKNLSVIGLIPASSVGSKKREAIGTEIIPSESPHRQTPVEQGLKDQNAALVQEIATLKAENVRRSKTVESVNQKNTAEILRKNTEIEFLKAEQQRIPALIQENFQLKSEHERLMKEFGSVAHQNAQEVVRLQQDVRRLTGDCNHFAAECRRLQETVAIYMSDKEKLIAEVNRLNKETAPAYQHLKVMGEELDKLKTDYGQYQTERQHLRNEIASLKSKNQRLEQDNRLVQGENYVYQAEREQDAKKLAAYKTATQSLTASLKRLASDFAGLKADIGGTKNQWQNSMNEISEVLSRQKTTAPWIKDLQILLERQQSSRPSAANVVLSTTGLTTSAENSDTIVRLSKEKEAWMEKYQNLRQKILDAQQRGPRSTKMDPATTCSTMQKEAASEGENSCLIRRL